ncbi:MAG: HAD family hydrolase [Candidatus Vogelbacteria bacterium]|nr:HAD family hydrolase [Candidatus Vogelbacteria bacterium]
MAFNFSNGKLLALIKQGSYAGVLLDLDDTLYDYKICHEFALRQTAKLWCQKTGQTTEAFLNSYEEAQKAVKIYTLNQGASHSRLLYFQNMSETKFGASKFKLTIELEKMYWDSFLTKIKLRLGVKDFLTELKNLGLKTCIITDLTASIQFAKVLKLNLSPLLDFIVSSEEAGVEKPAQKIFHLAQSKLGLPKGKLIMIGDDKNKDELGAKNFGIAYAGLD